MQLSNQAVGAMMLALQNSLMEQSDLVPVLRGFVLTPSDDGLVVTNPPVIHFDTQGDWTHDDIGE